MSLKDYETQVRDWIFNNPSGSATILASMVGQMPVAVLVYLVREFGLRHIDFPQLPKNWCDEWQTQRKPKSQ